MLGQSRLQLWQACAHQALLEPSMNCCKAGLSAWRPVAGGLGGAVAVDTSQATVGGSIFTGNSAKSQGGALYQVSLVLTALN